MADETAAEQPTGLPAHLRDDLKWQPGQSGNPAGRPKGARSILSDQFFKALQADFEENGVDVLRIMRTERPSDYAKMIASLQTKEISGEGGEKLGFVVFKGLNDAG